MAAVRHLGFVMTSQYCIAGHIFIVLKFHVDRFCSFRDNCNYYNEIVDVVHNTVHNIIPLCTAFWRYITDHAVTAILGLRMRCHVTISRGSKITTCMFLTPICLFTMPLLCVYDDD